MPAGSSRELAQQAGAFGLLYVTYVVAYLCRRNYGFFLNGILQRGDLDPTSAAVFGSTMEIAYGAGKLVAGPVCDNFKPKTLLICSLLVAALCNAAMFQLGLYHVDVALWAVNGLAQAFIWPAMALIFFNWFGKSNARGTLYSVLSTNQNLGSALTPVLLTPLVGEFGWRVALWGPAVVGVGFCVVLLVLLKEAPSSNTTTPVKAEEKKKEEEQDTSGYVLAVKQMLREREIWCLGLAYALLTVVRVGMADWGLVLLRAHLKFDSEYRARDCLVALELGGFVGGLAAGVVSDSLFRGNRVIVMVLFTLVIACPATLAVFTAPTAYAELAYLAFGFGSFGPHVLVGLLAREMFPRASSTAGTFAKSLAQVGGAIAGVPVSLISTEYGWGMVGTTWAASLALAASVFAVLLVPRTVKQKEE